MRRISMFVALAALVLSSSAAAQATPPQTRPGQMTPPATAVRPGAIGVLRGVVTAADTGGPLRRARVTLNAPGLRESRAATTDVDGRWEFKNLPAGRFTLSAGKPQYVTLEYGQRIPTEAGRPVELAAGQTLERLEFRLPRGSVISGRVVDDLGEPAASIRLQAFRLQYVGGRRQLAPTGVFGITDDLGQYRLAGLPPGTYYVGSSATLWGGSPEDVGISFGDTYYPGTQRPVDAQPVTVRLGQERPGVDLGLQTVRLASLSGVVVGSAGAPVANSSITLMQERRSATVSTVVSTSDVARTAADGRFTVRNIAPGEYFLSSLGTAPRFDVATERGSVAVSVAGQDIDGLTIALHKGSHVTGQIEFEGESRPTLTPVIRIYASEPGGGRGMSLPGTSAVKDDWSFEIVGVSPGQRLFRMTGLPATHVLKSVFVGDQDVIDTVTPFDGKEGVGVRLVVTDRVTTITGAVTDDRGRLVQDYSVVAFASDPDKWNPGTRFIGTARPDQHGRFALTGLPPGDYFVAALAYLERGDSEDPEFLASIKMKATSVSLAEGEEKSLALKVVVTER